MNACSHGVYLWILLSSCGLRSTPENTTKGQNQDKRGSSRIASAVVLGDELLWRLGPQTRKSTVAVSHLADDARYSPVANLWPESVIRLGTNPEMLLALNPELVLISSFSQPCYRAAIEDHLRTLEFSNFTGFEGYLDNLQKLGVAVQQQDQAEHLRQEFLAKKKTIEKRRGSSQLWPTCISWAYGNVPGLETTFHAAATTAGCHNVAAKEGLTGHRRVDAEQIVEWNPDFIVIGCSGPDTCDPSIDQFGKRPGFSFLRAVHTDHIIAVESAFLSTTGAGMLVLSERIQSGIHKVSSRVKN